MSLQVAEQRLRTPVVRGLLAVGSLALLLGLPFLLWRGSAFREALGSGPHHYVPDWRKERKAN